MAKQNNTSFRRVSELSAPEKKELLELIDSFSRNYYNDNKDYPQHLHDLYLSYVEDEMADIVYKTMIYRELHELFKNILTIFNPNNNSVNCNM